MTTLGKSIFKFLFTLSQNIETNKVDKNAAGNDLLTRTSDNSEDTELLCDDVLPYGWYRFLAYGM